MGRPILDVTSWASVKGGSLLYPGTPKPQLAWVRRVRTHNPARRPILDGLPSYELGEEAYAANEGGGTWVQQLLGTLGQSLAWLQPMLTPDNHDGLVACILDKARCPRCAGGAPASHFHAGHAVPVGALCSAGRLCGCCSCSCSAWTH